MSALRRAPAVLVVALLVAASCSSAPEGGGGAAPAPPAETSGPGGRERDRKKSDAKKPSPQKEDRVGDRKDRDREPSGSAGGDGGSEEKTVERAKGNGGSEAAPYPAAGRYVFSQEGYEEYCQQSQCDRMKLPARQPVTVAHKRASGGSADVVMEVRASDTRMARSTTRFDEDDASVLKVYVRSEYRGVAFEETYTPEPPVQSLRFPLAVGESWSGRWKDSTSGRYSIRITGREQVTVGGRSVDAFRFVTDLEFSGELNGKSRVVGWIDPGTKTIVRTDGVLNVTSPFGRYSTAFRTLLASGPGYG